MYTVQIIECNKIFHFYIHLMMCFVVFIKRYCNLLGFLCDFVHLELENNTY